MFPPRFVISLLMMGIVLCSQPMLPGADKPLAVLKVFVDELVSITPGEGQFPKSFTMGSMAGEKTEQPVHEVTFEQPFAIARYEVPQNLYEAVMGNNPSRWKGKRNSVEMMTYDDAVSFCEKLTALLHEHRLIDEAELIRLPTEAEWEYCCRAGTTTAYSFGDEPRKPGDAEKKASVLNEYGWHTGNAAGNDPAVGVLKPNPWGLYDMHGYLWEFTQDDWSPDYDHAHADGRAQSIENANQRPKQKALRGGSWKDPYPRLRSAARIAFPIDRGDDAVGIRCVKSRQTGQ